MNGKLFYISIQNHTLFYTMSYKILSLDGGGSWALIEARILKDIYDDAPGHEILGKFNMAIANSGGALILAGLTLNLRPSQLVEILESQKDREEVFSKLSFFESPGWNALKVLTKQFGPRYSAERKKKGLKKVMQQRTGTDKLVIELPMSQIPAKIGLPNLELIVCGYNYFTQRAVFFRSNASSKTDAFSGTKWDISMLDAIHAASNAPLNYFDEPALIQTGLLGTQLKTPGWYWDGAVGGFNNPVMAGVVEALTNGRGKTFADFNILSIGTSTGRRPVLVGWDEGTAEQKATFNANKNNDLVHSKKAFGFLEDLPKMATSILADPPDSATFIAYSVLKPDLENGACIVRINPCINPEINEQTRVYEVPKAWGDPADKKSFIDLLDLDMDAVKDSEVSLISRLCDKFIVTAKDQPCIPNQFIRGGTGGKHIGYGTYREAREKWLSCS